MTVWPMLDLVSTVGDSPVTVMVSAELSDFQLDVDRCGECGADCDFGSLDGLEALQFEFHVVGARRQPVESIGTG